MGEQDPYDTVGSDTKYRGKIITVRVDDVRMSNGEVAQREIVAHPGAVAVVALDEDGNIVLVNQYRPAIGARLDELPAGLLDVDGESALETAKRELAEEASLAAEDWDVLVDVHSSPGMTDEAVRIFLARGLTPVTSGFEAEHEELTIHVYREPLAEAVRRVLSGGVTNSSAVAGILAAVHGRATGWRDLRPADARWPARPNR